MSTVRKWGPWVLLAVAAAVALAFGLPRGAAKPSLDARVQHIAGEVRCPVCHGETAAQSQAGPSVEIRNEIRADLLKGRTNDQILASLVAAYGPGILEKPQAKGIGVLVWVIPVVATVVAGAALLFALRRWRRRPLPPGDADAAPAEVGLEPGGGGALVAAPPSARRPAQLALRVAGVLFVAGGASWAVVASSGTRLPGEEITGRVVAPEQVAGALQSAEAYQARGDAVDAVKQYDKVLAADPNQVDALTNEGWLLAETGQPALLQKGLGLMAAAERARPAYAPAHVYRGLAFLVEDDYGDAIPELQWYLGHHPDEQLVPAVRNALSRAQASQAAAAAASAATTTTAAR